MNRKKNNHYLKTDAKIKKALLEILGEQKNPTVSEICKRCQINRTTFYLHFVDIIALMEDVQEDIFASFRKTTFESSEEVYLMSYISYKLFAQHVKEYKDFYRYYFKINTSFPLKDGYEQMWEYILKPYYLEKGIEDEEIMKLRFVCFQAGFTNCWGKWVENDCDLSCDEVAKILTECITL